MGPRTKPMDPNATGTTPLPAPILDMLRFFAYEHLPPHLQAISKPIGDLATQMTQQIPASAELTAGLRKLLEAKDCFVRARLPR